MSNKDTIIEALTMELRLEREGNLALSKLEREKVASWMLERSYATGHGDTIEDLLQELEWQAAEREREACARAAADKDLLGSSPETTQNYLVAAIQARGDA